MAFIELNVLNNTAEPILGIDLGTTNSLAALWRDGRPEILKPEGHPGRIPSALYFPKDGGEPAVGQVVRERALVDPEGTIFSIKRFMGCGLADVKDELESVQFPASETAEGLLQFDVRGRKLTPQEISARILMRVQDVACKALGGHKLKRAVITVPAYFDDTQRQATHDAARIAGIDVARIINEPTAASLAYGLDQRKEGKIAVYDLGGGTFDISILSIDSGVFRVLSTSGDTHLGGDDLDRTLVALALEELIPKVGQETAQDPGFLQGLRLAAERCKHELSLNPEADFHFSIPDQDLRWHRRVKRAEFEKLIGPLVARTLDACRRVLSDAKLQASDIDEVVLVGGSTRVPAVRKAVEEFFGRAPHNELDPDQVVALGAAVQGHILSGGTRDILLMDVTSLSLGLETMGGAVSKIVVRNSPIPCQVTEGFTTYADNQTGIDFNIVQGERELAADCRSLGRFKLTGIPPMPAGMAKVSVRFQLDANGVLNVTAREESTGAIAEIEVQPMHGLQDDQVESMLQASYDNAQDDFDHRRAADLKVEIGTMIRASESNMEIASQALDPESLADLKDAIQKGHDVATLKDVNEVQAVRDELEQATLPLAAILMDSVAKKAVAGKHLSEI